MAQRIVFLAFLLTFVHSENPISIPKPASTEANIPRKEDQKVVSTETKPLMEDLRKDEVVLTDIKEDPKVISTDIKPVDLQKEELVLPEVAPVVPNPIDKPLTDDTKSEAVAADTPVAHAVVPLLKTLETEGKVPLPVAKGPSTESTAGEATEAEPKSRTKEAVESLKVQKKSLKDLLKTNEKFACAGTDYTAALRVKFEASSLSEETIANLFVFASCQPHCPNNARLLGVSTQVHLVDSGTTEASVSLSDKCSLKVRFDDSDFTGVVIQEQAEQPTQGASV